MASLEVAQKHNVVKASWMQRQSSLLNRWKYSFCVLYMDGKFAYYNDEHFKDEQGSIKVAKSCYEVNIGDGVVGVNPPAGRDKSCLLGLKTHENNLNFCADSVDDCISWKSAIFEVKSSLTAPVAVQPAAVAPAYAPPPYTVTQTAPAPQQTVITPVLRSAAYTAYRTPNTYVVRNTPSVIINRQVNYPVQSTVLAYPGQTMMYSYQQPVQRYIATAPTATTTIVYNR